MSVPTSFERERQPASRRLRNSSTVTARMITAADDRLLQVRD